MTPFPFNENWFSFFLTYHLLVHQLCTNPNSDRSRLSCLNVTQCSTIEIGDVPLYNHALYRFKSEHCQHPQNANPDGSTYPGWWKQSFQLRLWSLVWFQERATSCYLTSWKSAWKSTPKCTWMCWIVWLFPGVIRWPVADPGCGSRTRHRTLSPKRPKLGFRMSATTLYPSLTAPSSPDLNPQDDFVWSYVENITKMTSHNTKASLIPAIRRVFAEPPPALVEKACCQFRIGIEAVIEAEGGYIE